MLLLFIISFKKIVISIKNKVNKQLRLIKFLALCKILFNVCFLGKYFSFFSMRSRGQIRCPEASKTPQLADFTKPVQIFL